MLYRWKYNSLTIEIIYGNYFNCFILMVQFNNYSVDQLTDQTKKI